MGEFPPTSERPPILPSDLIEREISRASMFRDHALEGVANLHPEEHIVDAATYNPLLAWCLKVENVSEELLLEMAAAKSNEDIDEIELVDDVKSALARVVQLQPNRKDWPAERLKRIRVIAAVATADMDVNTLKALMAA